MKLLTVLLLTGCGIAASLASLPSARSGGTIKLRRSLRDNVKLPMNSDAAIAVTGEGSSPPSNGGGQATIATSTFNLAKSVIGAGVLALPSGVAFLADEPSALIPSSLLCAIFGIMSAYSFAVIGKICSDSGSSTFQDAWEKTVNKKSGWLITSSLTALCFLASLTYSIIMETRSPHSSRYKLF